MNVVYRRNGQHRFRAVALLLLAIALCSSVGAQSHQKRNRGETFHNCLSSNTAGAGDIWLTVSGVGHIWDDAGISMDTGKSEVDGFWASNVRGFPQAKVQAGFWEFAMLTIDSRVLSWGMAPGWVGAGAKFTWPNNKELRLNGFAFDCRYQYAFRDTSPTLGGYVGFMPEGFVVRGSSLELKMIYELDMLAKMTFLPLRLLVNGGVRIPFEREPTELYQFLGDAGIVYSGYGFDFYASYMIEAFNNFNKPIEVEQPGKRFLVFFPENASYFSVGGTVRYDNGLALSMCVPMLLSLNEGTKMIAEHQTSLDQKKGEFPLEESLDIRDPFDPWFVKWKIVLSAAFPIRAKMTGAEMMRNFLILKNRKFQRRIDIDNRLQNMGGPDGGSAADEQEDARRRLEEIRKRREEMQKTQ